MGDCEHPDRRVAVIPGAGDLDIPCVHCSECGYRRCDHAITCCNGSGFRLAIVPEHLDDAMIRASEDMLAALEGVTKSQGGSPSWYRDVLAAIAKAKGER